MALPIKKIRIKHWSWTEPQRAFWQSNARYRLFCAGIGSGKTHGGAIEIFRQPSNSHGMVVSATYTMLRDSTLRTFLDLAHQSGTLASFNKSDMVAVLINGVTILFRSADDPDKLRGPNCGWVWLDEGSLVEQEVWLILMGRLREQPARAWITTTPRGHNWLYDVFVKNADENYAIIQSSTTDNPFLPPGFVESLKAAYPDEWQLQEIDGKFVQTAGAIFNRAWFEIVEQEPENLRWVRYWDLATSIKTTADYSASACMALANDGTLYVRDMVRGRWEWPDAKKIIMQTMLAEPDTQHGIEEAMHGLAAVQELQRERSIAHVSLKGIRVDRDKVSRALPVAARAEQGKVKLVAGAWVKDLLDELISFPSGRHDDQVDTLSGGLQMIARPQGIWKQSPLNI